MAFKLARLTVLATLLVGHLVKADEPGVCPQDDGKYRSTSAGTFLITCGKRSGMGRLPDKNPEIKPSFAACIDACATRTGCKSVDYKVDTRECTYFRLNKEPTIEAASAPITHNARLATAPQQPVSDPGAATAGQTGSGQASGGQTSSGQTGSGAAGGTDGGQASSGQTGSGAAGGTGGDQSASGPDDTILPVTEPVPIMDPSNQTLYRYTTKPECPADHGKVFVTSEGTTYGLQCEWHDTRTKVGVHVTATWEECMEKCSETVDCSSAKYNPRPPPGDDADPIQGRCYLYKEGGPAPGKCPPKQHDFAYAIDPPEVQAFDNPSHLCSTECPQAHGMTYASSYGEVFRMTCEHRHGTKVLGVAQADSFQDCMEMCAAMVPCHSVDYQARTKKCYFGSHHGDPEVPARSFAAAHSMGCSNACSEGDCGKGKVENRKTPVPFENTPTGKPSLKPDTSCGNVGLEYGVYCGLTSGGSAFNPEILKTAKPESSGVTESVGLASSSPIYGKTPSDPSHVIVHHRGFLFAKEAGEYTFSASSCDDSLYFWIGRKAYNQYTSGNADITQRYVASGGQPKTFKIYLEEGGYFAFRLIWVNAGGPGFFGFEVKAPDGSVVLDGSSGKSEYLVRYPCDSTIAEKYPEFGKEV